MTTECERRGEAAARVTVWDPFVRFFHWSLVCLVAWAAVSGLLLQPTWLRSHIVSGAAAVTLVGVRIIWGFLGPTYARFAGFLFGPRAVLRHIRELPNKRGHCHLGHNPLGGLMIFTLLFVVMMLALTGTIALGGSLKSGPLAFATRFTVGETVLEIHEWLAYVLIGLVVLHVGGVLLESRRSSEHLVAAMVHGNKLRRPGDREAPNRKARPLAAITFSIAGVTLFFLSIAVLSALPGLGAPVQPLDPLYVEECGACHTPYHPSLAPARMWTSIMQGLDEHFGEDASLDSASADDIRGFLLANSAEVFDTKPANRMRVSNPADPLRITATAFWQRAHAGIAAAVFTARGVGGPAACDACHPDAATGLYYPALINLPEDTGR